METTDLAWRPTKEGMREAQGTRPQNPQGFLVRFACFVLEAIMKVPCILRWTFPRKVSHQWYILDTEPVTWYCGCVAQAMRGCDLVTVLEWAAERCVSSLDPVNPRMTSRPSYMFNSISTWNFHNLNLKKKWKPFLFLSEVYSKVSTAHVRVNRMACLNLIG